METITRAAAGDREAVLRLYRKQIGREFCPWTEDYPGKEEIEYDLERDALFVMKTGEGEIIAAISIDLDENVEGLDCWTPSLRPGREISRVAVDPAWQNRGLARRMLTHAMQELKRQGYRSVHFLVNRHNVKAIRSYDALGFDVVGTCEMYNQPFLCYEKDLDTIG